MSRAQIRQSLITASVTRANLITMTVAEAQMLLEIADKVAGLIHTAHPTDIGKHEVVPQWWNALVVASDALERS